MAKKKKAVIIEEPEEEDIEVEEKAIEEDKVEEQPERTEELSPIDKLKQEFGENYNVVVYRLADDGSEWQRVGKYPLSTLDLDRLAEQYNGGRFRLQVLLPNGRYGTQMTVSYASKVVKNDATNGKDSGLLKEIELLKTQLLQMQNKEKENSNGLYATLIKMLENEREQNKNLFSAIINGLSNQNNVFQSLQQSIMQAMLKQEKNDFLDTLIKAKQSGLLPENEKLDLRGLIEIFNSGLNLGKEVGTVISASPENLETKVFDKIIDMIASKVLQKQPEQITQPVVQSILPAPAPASTQAQPTQSLPLNVEIPRVEQKGDVNMSVSLEEEIKKHKDDLLDVANKKVLPKIVVNYIFSQIPPTITEQQIIEFLKTDKIYELIPELKEHKEYVEQLKSEFIQYLT